MEVTDMKTTVAAIIMALCLTVQAGAPPRPEQATLTIRPLRDNHVILEVTKCPSNIKWTIWAATEVTGPYDVKMAEGVGRSGPLEHPTLFPQRFFRLELELKKD